MATLILGTLGGTVGGALFGPLGALAGRALGALGGSAIDSLILTPGQRSEGPRLSEFGTMTSTEGAALPRLYGRARLSGQVIWAAPVQEVVSTQTQSAGGKGGGLAGGGSSTTTYAYFGSFAVGLCEGKVTRIGRIWADGRLLDTRGLNLRLHLGAEDQLPDPLIEARAPAAPAYRGLAYLVFEGLALARFGNRLPQISVEVERAVGALEGAVRAVTLIPGATEFGYEPREVLRVDRPGVYQLENRHVTTHASDFSASLDQLLATCPNLERVALVVTWFGTDLRAGQCQIRPAVERRVKPTQIGIFAEAWQVAGQTRASAALVSQYEGKPAYGGTPSDASVIAAIAALKVRGLKVTLNPFVMMDIPAGNALPDPWSGAASQPAHPWRGRITCHPAPGVAGSPDGTAAAGAQVTALFGTASAAHFGASGGRVTYSGPAEWGLRRMVLHYARLAQIAGGVEAILIGSEMAALTRVRSAPGTYPAAAAFAALAGEVKAMLGAGTQIGYGADWTEYGAHVLGGGAEVRFPLDPLWASPALDFIGIDWYPPLADWRDGDAHLDAESFESGHDPAYLEGNLDGGEAFDWYYPDDAARAAQARAPITDGAYGEAWLFRQKDLAGWWANAHHERVGGVRQASPTGFVPGSKPVRLTEIGCPAVDKGANRPSAFPDPKSTEGGLPPFSNGARDDLIQRRHLQATLAGFAGSTALNPAAAGLPGGRMVDPAAITLWTWDARPFPVFPRATNVWADGANWQTGHWLTGRLGAAPLAELTQALAADFGVPDLASGELRGIVDGYVVDRPMTARAALEPLARAFGFDLNERGGALSLRPRGGRVRAVLDDDDIVAGEGIAAPSLVRAAESELPLSATLGFIDGNNDYRRATAVSRRLAGAARAETGLDVAMVADPGLAAGLADMWLQDAWAGRDRVNLTLPPGHLALEPGDLLRWERDGRARLLEIVSIEDREARAVSARGIDPAVFALAVRDGRAGAVDLPGGDGPPLVHLVELPLESGEATPALAWIGGFVTPWPGSLAVWRAVDGGSFQPLATLAAPAVTGATLTELAPGPVWRWHRASLDIELDGGLVAGASEEAVLGGANALALIDPAGAVEVIQFVEAELIGAARWRLSGLLRGQLGTEARAATAWPAGTRLMKIDANLVPVARGLDLVGRAVVYRISGADRDHGDAAVTEIAATLSSAALRPFAPVHARARRGAAGVTLSWTRRTRSGGDSWDLVEVPLGETGEAYEVEILGGASVRRRFTTTAPSLLYPAGDEIADFGAAQTFLDVRIAQLSAEVGAGAALTARLRL
ncbi:glycoside hydrolase/phage tail family protein [Ancylobacter dichloromethanicus]|uniref:Phage host specificity protein n=1 Tax=Ancylobacter dichloromethanicus TaxID=518825 RepID=A0A9W6MXD2_9HYPH|nr:glycoside hydrolase/phage tail family protein [Ancylobacter dichloromethanicus]MBS7556157.1 glycoside hydrolase/phage tail family protein [Ancylobacter dichloromethanicus]GLK69911.1 phage host specificity protein [Ancylobacter dichloromethanicus]